MKHLVLASALLLTFAGASIQEEGPWQVLFNGQDLKGWDTYLGRPQPAAGQSRQGIPPIGLNIDPAHVFTVVTLDGEKALLISGETFGGVSTVAEFENYHFQT